MQSSAPERPEIPASVLVVDDDPTTLRLAGKTLRDWGYAPRLVLSGAEALESVRADAPEIVMLDINMPDMDGYAVCEALKSDPALSSIPVIFVSGYNEVAEKVRAFRCGGVDYITKPFQPDELRARLATHIGLVRKARALWESYDKLSRTEKMRDAMVNMVVHDLRSPLTAISLSLEYLAQETRDALSEDCIGLVDEALTSVRWMGQMINSMLDLHKLESGLVKLAPVPCDLAVLTRDAVSAMRILAGDRALIWEPFAGKATVLADREILSRVLQTLVGNSLKLVPDGGTIRVGVRAENDGFRVRVRDDAPAIPPEYHELLFDKFEATRSRDKKKAFSSGLALPFCRAGVEAQGGSAGMSSRPDEGNSFWIFLPAHAA